MQKSTKAVREATICSRRGRKVHGFQYLGMVVVVVRLDSGRVGVQWRDGRFSRGRGTHATEWKSDAACPLASLESQRQGMVTLPGGRVVSRDALGGLDSSKKEGNQQRKRSVVKETTGKSGVDSITSGVRAITMAAI